MRATTALRDPSQLVILQLRPASGDQNLPTMRAKGQEHPHTVLRNIRNKYAVAGAILGVASNPEKLAETALLQYPTRDSPNLHHLYQGTQRSFFLSRAPYSALAAAGRSFR